MCVWLFKRRGLFCPPALSFLGELEFILYVLLLNMICNFLSGLSCKKKKKKNPPRNEIRREKEKGSLIFNDLLFSSSSQDTWRWFRSRKVRSTSRSKSSPCRKITSVSDDLETIAGHMNHQTNVHLASSFMLVVPRRWSSLTFMIPWFSLRRHHEVDVLVSG